MTKEQILWMLQQWQRAQERRNTQGIGSGQQQFETVVVAALIELLDHTPPMGG